MPGLTYTVEFNQPKGNDFGSLLNEVVRFMISLKANPDATKIDIDLSKIRFVNPLFILSVSSLSELLIKKGVNLKIKSTSNPDCASYLEKIFFPNGIKPDILPDWENALSQYRGKSYLPIINFSSDKNTEPSTIREKLISKINSLIKENLKLDESYVTAVSYLISEITDNIIEHSGEKRGWLMVQYYPYPEYLDICIIDTGKTILGSYKDHGFEGMDTDSLALESALKGISTKDQERGTGLRSSNAISSMGLGGDFALFSGNAIFFRNKILTLQVSWPGTFVAMRIKKGIENFSIYSYV
jgi:anti-sigma regulatory factor (Ser/Thr protein kinase)